MTGGFVHERDRNGLERAKVICSIEQLLIWAYRDQRVHLALRSELGQKIKLPKLATSSMWSHAAPSKASTNQGYPAAQDAWLVHHAVMALGHYRTDCGHDLAAARYHRSRTYRGATPPIGLGEHWPTDGLLDIDRRSLVICNALRATRPLVGVSEPVRFEPDETVWHPKQRSKVYAKGWFCHVRAEGDLPGDQIEAWETYMAWRAALVEVQQRICTMNLTMFAVGERLPPLLDRPAFG